VTVLYRIICIIVGYACGLIETGVIYGKIRGVDIRKYGSKNLGTTNALRVLGPKAGIIVLIGDFCKSFIPCVLARLIFQSAFPDTFLIYVLYTGFGAVLGHVFPFYLGFKGGKGVATIAGMIVGLLSGWLILILLVLFVATVAISKYLSVGSICLMIEFAVIYVIFALMGRFCFVRTNPESFKAMIESFVIVFLFAGLSVYRHKENIGRLMRHEENKFSFKKSDKIKIEEEG
jgi:acyl-phosphate glycerol 3-phosphate acyltransferase